MTNPFGPRFVIAHALLLTLATTRDLSAQAASRKPQLSRADVADIVLLEKIEDRRDYDSVALQRFAAAKHPELRRRAALAVARLYDFRGRTILASMRSDPDTAVLATVVWATGQLIDTSAVGWINGLLQSRTTPPGIMTESAGAFGKIRTPETTRHLETFLLGVKASPTTKTAIGEALLSIGRAIPAPTSAAAARWVTSRNPELRWRATWSLGRVVGVRRNALLRTLANDPSGEVRSWATGYLAWNREDSLFANPEQTRDLLLRALNDPDRRVRTEAINALSSHKDSVTRDRIVALLDDRDGWITAAAIDALVARRDSSETTVAALVRATDSSRPIALRASALSALGAIGAVTRRAAFAPALEMARDTSLTVRIESVRILWSHRSDALPELTLLARDSDRSVRSTALSALFRIADSTQSLEDRRKARRTAIASGDIASRIAATQSMRRWADTSDIPLLLDAYSVALRDSSSSAVWAAINALGAIDKVGGSSWAKFFARFPSSPNDVVYGFVGWVYGQKTVERWGNARPAQTSLTDADYERIVRTLVVPAYNGARPPRVVWETSRGPVTTDLNALDAPLATDNLLQLAARGSFKHVRFDRVVPNFVAQQESALIDEPLQRDEISRGRLVRANLSWASSIAAQDKRGPGSSYDTGPAAYTFAHTVQPDNEGDFTALGRIVSGMQVVDKIELGDYVTAVRIVRR
jgi:cyclophilin family peptidyl-prolyl cis-trans isomerase/HEAT repeat protein